MANFFLFFGSAKVVTFLIALGYFLYDPVRFGRLIQLVVFSIIVNKVLKGYFQVPLLPTVGPGWSFPSGHAQTATVVYLWLLLEWRFSLKNLPFNWPAYKDKWAIPFLAIIVGEAWALVAAGYHQPEDVMAGVGVGILLVILERICYVWQAKYKVASSSRVLTFSLIALGIFLSEVVFHPYLPADVREVFWIWFGINLGIFFACERLGYQPVWTFKGMIFTLMIGVMGSAALWILTQNFASQVRPFIEQWDVAMVLRMMVNSASYTSIGFILTGFFPWVIEKGCAVMRCKRKA